MQKQVFLKFLQYASYCKLTAANYKICLFLLPKLMDKKQVQVNQKQVAIELGITTSEVSKGLRALERNGIIQFTQISERKKLLSVVQYTEDQLDAMITEKVERIVDENDDWE